MLLIISPCLLGGDYMLPIPPLKGTRFHSIGLPAGTDLLLLRWDTVDGRNPKQPVEVGSWNPIIYPMIYRVFYIQTVVVWDFWTINSMDLFPGLLFLGPFFSQRYRICYNTLEGLPPRPVCVCVCAKRSNLLHPKIKMQKKNKGISPHINTPGHQNAPAILLSSQPLPDAKVKC